MLPPDAAFIPDMVSTIIPVFNRGALLVEAVDSVLEQSWRSVEIVIVDDGSTDDTLCLARELAARHPAVIRVIHQENAGPGPARQAGLRLARGEFIQFLDSDDLLLTGKFERQVAGLRADPEAGISYGLSLVRDESGNTSVTHGTDRAHRDIFPAVLQSRIWPTIAPLYRRSVCDAIGDWTNTRVLEDLDYDCRAGLLGVKLHYCPEPVALRRTHSEGHAGRAWQHDPQAMRDRLAAQVAVVGHAKSAGVAPGSPEMQQLIRSVFRMARSAGEYGLPLESKRLFLLASENATASRWQYWIYGSMARILGWQRAARLSEALRSLR